jgi:hypothetical protein
LVVDAGRAIHGDEDLSLAPQGVRGGQGAEDSA